ncbi:probable phytol kinase 1, chloroplastic [Coffea eugenioides]|uniref:probable phytol kinase 1, chloroplastic n=1 Tax=Coffea eugenioides TaxID=49369 RepID=UPI000F610520|nr:probable phytol kinase 1, chloroplastic [Coffea eugenioides]
MAIGTKVSVGVIVAASSLANCRTTLSLVQFHLPLLRPRLPSAGPLHNLPLAHVSNLIKSGYCIQTSQEKNNYTRSCKQRAFFGDGGLELHDAGATALVVAGAYTLVSTFDKLTSANLIQQNLSRKLVHILSGLLFMASWPMFSTSTGARYFASLVPLINCLRLIVYGLSLAKDEGLVNSVTREGKPEELLRGPLYYVMILILSAIFFWRDSPVGVVSVSMMCGGDGIADIMGRRFGSLKLPYNQQKSWAGSLSMFVFGFLISIGMLYYFSALGCFQLDWSCTIQRVALVSLVATLVESLPTTGIVDDNISVPIASMVTAFLSFGY